MPRLTDADALLDDITERYCKDCERRKGIKNGKKKFIYDIGDAPCRACEVDDMKYELESAPTVEVVYCKDCRFYNTHDHRCVRMNHGFKDDFFCSWGERKDE